MRWSSCPTRIAERSPMGCMKWLAPVVLACAGAPGCSVGATVHVVVWESAVTAPVVFEQAADEPTGWRSPGTAIPKAVILHPVGRGPDDLAGFAARIRDDPTLASNMRRRIGESGDGALAMRTDAAGAATYTELQAFLFVPDTLEREFYVWADGFGPRRCSVEIRSGEYVLRVPLVRDLAR